MTSFHPASKLKKSSQDFNNSAIAEGICTSANRNSIADRVSEAQPLGTNAESSSTYAHDLKRESAYSPRVARAERYRLQAIAQKILWKKGVSEGLQYPANYHKTAKCLRTPVASRIDIHQSSTSGRTFYGAGLVVCGKPGCPTCSSKIQERRREEIAQGFNWAYDLELRKKQREKIISDAKALLEDAKKRNPESIQTNNLEKNLLEVSVPEVEKKIVMVTFTFPHGHSDRLKDLLKKQQKAFEILRKTNAWNLFKKRVGYEGLIRSLETTYGDAGWHPHTHEAWIVNADADVKSMLDFVTERWLKACKKVGLIPHGKTAAFRKHAVDIQDNCRASDYLAKSDKDADGWGADRELAKSSSKKGRKAGRSIFQILADAETDEKSAGLYLEFVEAMRGKAQIFWSHGLKDRVGIEDLKDQQIADKIEDKADLLGLLSLDQWKIVIAHDARSHVLDLAEDGGWPAVKNWLDAPYLPKEAVKAKEKREMTTFKQFCQHYDLDVDDPASKTEYRRYVENLRVFQKLDKKQEGPPDKQKTD